MKDMALNNAFQKHLPQFKVFNENNPTTESYCDQRTVFGHLVIAAKLQVAVKIVIRVSDILITNVTSIVKNVI